MTKITEQQQKPWLCLLGESEPVEETFEDRERICEHVWGWGRGRRGWSVGQGLETCRDRIKAWRRPISLLWTGAKDDGKRGSKKRKCKLLLGSIIVTQGNISSVKAQLTLR